MSGPVDLKIGTESTRNTRDQCVLFRSEGTAVPKGCALGFLAMIFPMFQRRRWFSRDDRPSPVVTEHSRARRLRAAALFRSSSVLQRCGAAKITEPF